MSSDISIDRVAKAISEGMAKVADAVERTDNSSEVKAGLTVVAESLDNISKSLDGVSQSIDRLAAVVQNRL